MAREVTEIYNDIIESKNSRSDLSDLNSNSNVAIYKLWAFICAVAIFSHEVLWDLLQVNIDNTLDSRINGTSEWYSLKALEYQDGDELKRLNNGLSLGYDPVNPQNRVVTRAAYSDNNGVLDLKLANLVQDGPILAEARKSAETILDDDFSLPTAFGFTDFLPP